MASFGSKLRVGPHLYARLPFKVLSADYSRLAKGDKECAGLQAKCITIELFPLHAWLAELLYRCSQREERWRYRSSDTRLKAGGKHPRLRVEELRSSSIVMR